MTRSAFKPRCMMQMEVVFDGRGAPNSIPLHFEVAPRNVNVGFNGYYEADTWNVEFDAKLLPFDPDQIAYCAIRVYMWNEDNVGVEWAVDQNLMTLGLADDCDSTWIGSDYVVKLTGRDYTSLLADAAYDSTKKIKGGRPLDEVVQELADDAAPQGARGHFQVEFRGGKNPLTGEQYKPPIVGSLQRSAKKTGIWVKPGKTYWDTIWDLCLQHAYTARVENTTIIIAEPRTETLGPQGSLAEAPQLVYGQTLTGLKIKRKFAHEKVPQIIIRYYDPLEGKQHEVIYPKKTNIVVDPLKAGTTGPSGGGASSGHSIPVPDQPRDALGIPLAVKKDEQMYFAAPRGCITKEAAEREARNRFYHLGRGETTYSLETRHLYIDDQFGEVNLLRLRPSDPIGVVFDPFNQTILRGLKEVGQRASYIMSLGYQPKIAMFVANNFDRMDLFKQVYYYNKGSVDYDNEEGVEIKLEAVNFASAPREIHFANETDAITGVSPFTDNFQLEFGK